MTGPINLYNIYYGDFSGQSGATGTRTLIDYLAAHLGNSSWYHSTTEYYQINPDDSKTYASNIVNFPQRSVNIYPSKRGASNVIEETDLVTDIINLINSKTLPLDVNGIYAVIFRGDLTFGDWLQSYGWCGYHTSFGLTNGDNIRFFVVGDPSKGPADLQANCAGIAPPTANGNLGADSIASIYAHELVETVTDWSGAWYFDSNNFENADQCAWQFGVNLAARNWNYKVGDKNFLIQTNWVIGKGCIL
eukprot:CAMPEP_0170073096 /NCGR_PEP_ID=MMETSP0019_2-20121128/10574_1 /TAXON_ID=98059 /ORGANISM="Dinobryon sp., Strain UTEXLB2267" /LENGTH=247 /DNA_ID=CAMNT_0010282405 /DNA_START=809 /DNA_END=1552 /DNA_ORIENTATION=+